jgi:hypothetical protein
MVSLRLAVPAILAAAVAGCFAYLVTPPQIRGDDHQPSSTVPNFTGPGTTASTSPDRSPAEEKAAEAYQQAAEEILRRLPNLQASAGPDEQPITGRIPLPKRRPIAAP